MRMLTAPIFHPFTLPLVRGFSPFGLVPSGDTIPTYTNAQKLSLPANTAVGTQVKVSDGFVVSGSGVDVNVFWFPSGTTANGHTLYRRLETTTDQISNLGTGNTCFYDTDHWEIENLGGTASILSEQDVAEPWLASSWISVGVPDPATLTHPAVQQLASPSSAQGGVFVSGGTQDGVYTDRGDFDGKRFYNLLGQPDDGDFYAVNWSIGGMRWYNKDQDGTPVYYALSNVATPDLAGTDKVVMAVSGVAYSKRGTFNGKSYYNVIGQADSTTLNAIVWSSATWHITNAIGVDLDTSTTAVATPDLATFLLGTVVTNTAWLNAADDSPASITVASTTSGQIAAGIKYGSDFYTVTTPVNGRNAYHDVLGVAPDFTWTGTIWSDGTHNGTGAPAFPWDVTGIVITRDDVASEINWSVV